MDFFPRGLKGFAADAATVLNRAVQFTEERLGHGERTELDSYLENLLSRAEQIRSWTEKLAASAEAVLQPNPGSRVEDYLIEKLGTAGAGERRTAERPRNLEALGGCMLAAGTELTPGDSYGSALIRCGQTQLKIGQLEREFANKAERDFIRPLRRFLEDEAKALAREKRALEAKRLDLDAAKSKYRKVRASSQAQAQGPPTAASLGHEQEVVRELDQVEAELLRARQEFDRQVELVTGLCNKIIQSGEQHAKCLSKFVEAQAECLQQSDRQLDDLLNGRSPGGASSSPRNNSTGFASLAALSEESLPDVS